MSAPTSDDRKVSEFTKYAPKHIRNHPTTPADEQRYVDAAPTAPSPSPTDLDDHSTPPEFPSWVNRAPPTPSEFASWAAPIRGPQTKRQENWALIGRIAAVVTLAALVALLTIVAKPLWQSARVLFNADSQTAQGSKPADRIAVNRTRMNAPSEKMAVAAAKPPSANAPAPSPLATVPAQQRPIATIAPPMAQEAKSNVRGVTDSEIQFGISAPFSGPAKDLGQGMSMGIQAAFDVANAAGGIYGRKLHLVAANDGYEPARTAETMKQLYDKDRVFGLIGDVGTPTAVVALPYALQRKMLFFGAFTGAGLLRRDPPDRYVFNIRASYAEETAAVVNYLVKVKRLRPQQIAVFAQQDSYGDAGFAGVEKAIRALQGGREASTVRLNYKRNTIDVDDAVAQLKAEQLKRKHLPIKAVIMVPTYRAAARFIEKTRNLYPDMIYTSVSFVGSTALANELMLLGKEYAKGVIVTQVVPAVDGYSSLVLEYKSALAKSFPGQQPDYVSLEGYVDAKVMIAALKRNGRDLSTEKLVGTLEHIHNLDIGLGTPVSFSPSDHQALHKVWGTQLDENGHYQPIDLE